MVVTTEKPEGFRQGGKEPVNIAGFFYKTNVWRVDATPGQGLPPGDPTQSLVYPVIVARKINHFLAESDTTTSTNQYFVMMGIALAILVFLFLFRTYNRLRQRGTTLGLGSRMAARSDRTDGDAAADGVDPELQRQVQQLKAEKKQSSGQGGSR
jgi:hypothetical protein